MDFFRALCVSGKSETPRKLYVALPFYPHASVLHRILEYVRWAHAHACGWALAIVLSHNSASLWFAVSSKPKDFLVFIASSNLIKIPLQKVCMLRRRHADLRILLMWAFSISFPPHFRSLSLSLSSRFLICMPNKIRQRLPLASRKERARALAFHPTFVAGAVVCGIFFRTRTTLYVGCDLVSHAITR